MRSRLSATEYEVAEYGRARALTAHPEKVWRLFGHLRAQLSHAQPNEAHCATARAQAFLEARGASFLLITCQRSEVSGRGSLLPFKVALRSRPLSSARGP